jgi:hypothetical protein
MSPRWPGGNPDKPGFGARTGSNQSAAGQAPRPLKGRECESLVEGPDRTEFQSFDLVPKHEFTALQLGDPQVVGGKMPAGIVQLAFQDPMFPFQFSEMRLNCHSNLLGRINLRFASDS